MGLGRAVRGPAGEGQAVPGSECSIDTLRLGDLADMESSELAQGDRVARLLVTLEADIIPRIAQAHGLPATRSPSEPVFDAVAIDAFARALIGRDAALPEQRVRDLQSIGISRELLLDELFAPAARRLGVWWEEDVCVFADVTVGVGRMQRLLRDLSAGTHPAPNGAGGGHRILMLAVPGEQHTFGLAVAAEHFRAAGWDVTRIPDSEAPDPAAQVGSQWFDLIGYSAATEARLLWLRDSIAGVRRASRNTAIKVLVGGAFFAQHPEHVARVGADSTAGDGQESTRIAAGLLRQAPAG